jgi:hypothetical protein
MGITALSRLIRGIFFYTNSPNCRWLKVSKVSVVSIIIATIIEVLPAAESACSKTSQALPQRIKQLVKELEYSDEVAENFALMVNQWQDKNKTPFLITLEDNLIKAKEGYKQGKISKRELAKTERGIAEKLIRRIRKGISVNDKEVFANHPGHSLGTCRSSVKILFDDEWQKQQ